MATNNSQDDFEETMLPSDNASRAYERRLLALFLDNPEEFTLPSDNEARTYERKLLGHFLAHFGTETISGERIQELKAIFSKPKQSRPVGRSAIATVQDQNARVDAIFEILCLMKAKRSRDQGLTSSAAHGTESYTSSTTQSSLPLGTPNESEAPRQAIYLRRLLGDVVDYLGDTEETSDEGMPTTQPHLPHHKALSRATKVERSAMLGLRPPLSGKEKMRKLAKMTPEEVWGEGDTRPDHFDLHIQYAMESKITPPPEEKDDDDYVEEEEDSDDERSSSEEEH